MKNISEATSSIIRELYNNGNPNKAVLASLRSANSIEDKRAEKVWPLIFNNVAPGDLTLDATKPSWAEVAIFTALRCYAIFQQGQDDYCVFDRKKGKDGSGTGVTLFKALNQIRNDDNHVALDRRVDNVLVNTNVPSVINSIVHLDKILKGQKTKLKVDFAELAKNLYYFQQSHDQARGVCLAWGREYYWNTYKKEN